MGSTIKILQETDTFLLHHSPPTQRPPNKEMFQKSSKVPSVCVSYFYPKQAKEEGQYYAIPRRVGHKMGTSLKLKHNNKL